MQPFLEVCPGRSLFKQNVHPEKSCLWRGGNSKKKPAVPIAFSLSSCGLIKTVCWSLPLGPALGDRSVFRSNEVTLGQLLGGARMKLVTTKSKS